MIYERTIHREVSVVGIGLHLGKRVCLTLKPAMEGTGILFVRKDLGGREVRAHAFNVVATENNTTLGNQDCQVYTVEHLLAALYALGIDHVICELDGPEVPIMDGSSASFILLLKEAGVSFLSAEKKFLKLKKNVRVINQDKWAEITPGPDLFIKAVIEFSHPKIRRQERSFHFSCEAFLSEIARARTFGMMRDVDALKRRGLIQGASLNNAIGLSDFQVLNEDGLRYEDEFVRHKILDAVGDMSLIGHQLLGHMTTYKSGHALHNQLCREILKSEENYEIVSSRSFTGQQQSEDLKIPRSVAVNL